MNAEKYLRLSAGVSGIAFLILFIVPILMSFLTTGTSYTWWHGVAVKILSNFPYLILLFVYTVIVGIVVAIQQQTRIE